MQTTTTQLIFGIEMTITDLGFTGEDDGLRTDCACGRKIAWRYHVHVGDGYSQHAAACCCVPCCLRFAADVVDRMTAEYDAMERAKEDRKASYCDWDDDFDYEAEEARERAKEAEEAECEAIAQQLGEYAFGWA